MPRRRGSIALAMLDQSVAPSLNSVLSNVIPPSEDATLQVNCYAQVTRRRNKLELYMYAVPTLPQLDVYLLSVVEKYWYSRCTAVVVFKLTTVQLTVSTGTVYRCTGTTAVD